MKRPLGRPRPRWEDNIKMDLKKININTRGGFGSGQRLLGNPCECDIEPPGLMRHGVRMHYIGKTNVNIRKKKYALASGVQTRIERTKVVLNTFTYVMSFLTN